MPNVIDEVSTVDTPEEGAVDFCLAGEPDGNLFCPEFEQRVAEATTVLEQQFTSITDPY